MSELSTRIVIVAYSPQSSVAFFMKDVFERVGLTVNAATSTLDDLEAVVGRDRPTGIVYDVSFPFTQHWEQLQKIRRRRSLRGIPIVVTTSEPRELFRATGCSSAIELFARPNDIAPLKEALLTALNGRPSGHAAA